MKRDLAPVVYVTASRIQQSLPTRALTVLMDTGSSHTMIKLTSLPHGASVTSSAPKKTTTTNGTFTSNAQVTLTNVKFPEFGNHLINKIQADVFDSPTCRYDIILGRDILEIMGATIDFDQHTIRWLGRDLPMKDPREIRFNSASREHEAHLSQEEEEDFLLFEAFADDILIKDRKYQAVSPEEVVVQLHHLSKQQRQLLKLTFEKYKRVFAGKLGKHPTAKIDIELVPNAKPIYQNPYPVSFKRKPLFQRELNNMIADGVFT